MIKVALISVPILQIPFLFPKKNRKKLKIGIRMDSLDLCQSLSETCIAGIFEAPVNVFSVISEISIDASLNSSEVQLIFQDHTMAKLIMRKIASIEDPYKKTFGGKIRKLVARSVAKKAWKALLDSERKHILRVWINLTPSLRTRIEDEVKTEIEAINKCDKKRSNKNAHNIPVQLSQHQVPILTFSPFIDEQIPSPLIHPSTSLMIDDSIPHSAESNLVISKRKFDTIIGESRKSKDFIEKIGVMLKGIENCLKGIEERIRTLKDSRPRKKRRRKLRIVKQ